MHTVKTSIKGLADMDLRSLGGDETNKARPLLSNTSNTCHDRARTTTYGPDGGHGGCFEMVKGQNTKQGVAYLCTKSQCH